jgi:hypothetical protein
MRTAHYHAAFENRHDDGIVAVLAPEGDDVASSSDEVADKAAAFRGGTYDTRSSCSL